MTFSKKLMLIIMLSTLLNACFLGSGIETKHFSPKNPTCYIFSIKGDEMEKIILKIFTIEYQYKKPLPFKSSDKFSPVYFDIYGVFITQEKKRLIKLVGSPSWVSEVYYYEGSPTNIRGEYLLTLEEINNKIKLSITVIKLKAFAGKNLINMGHGGAKLEDVESTTIEEYKILKYIANYLGISIPPINKPNKE